MSLRPRYLATVQPECSSEKILTESWPLGVRMTSTCSPVVAKCKSPRGKTLSHRKERAQWFEAGVLRLFLGGDAMRDLSIVSYSSLCLAVVLSAREGRTFQMTRRRTRGFPPAASLAETVACPILTSLNTHQGDYLSLVADWCMGTLQMLSTDSKKEVSGLCRDAHDAQNQMASYIALLRRVKVTGMRNSLASF